MADISRISNRHEPLHGTLPSAESLYASGPLHDGGPVCSSGVTLKDLTDQLRTPSGVRSLDLSRLLLLGDALRATSQQPHDDRVEFTAVWASFAHRLASVGLEAMGNSVTSSLPSLQQARCAASSRPPFERDVYLSWIEVLTPEERARAISVAETLIEEWTSHIVESCIGVSKDRDITTIGYTYPLSRRDLLQHFFNTALQGLIELKGLLED